MNRKTFLRQGRSVAMAACALLAGTMMMQSCQDDDILLTGQPSWLGNSIYERLQDEGNYSYTLRLIDDLDYREVMSHTGSKTLFVADDQAYETWFANNDWGVKSYSELTTAQKKMLLYNSMINNAYLIELLSNTKGENGSSPEIGMCMRRETASSPYDSIYVMKWQDMPKQDMPVTTQMWASLRERQKDIRIMMDNTKSPMIHFLPKFMEQHKITAADLDILTNHKANSIQEAWVNGVKVVERDITCKNGYIQKVESVIESVPNMAQILMNDTSLSIWYGMLSRFSVPEYSKTASDAFYLDSGIRDSIYVLRFYSDIAKGSDNKATSFTKLSTATKDAEATLKFDPAWNQLIYRDGDMHKDAAVMFVPSNEAFLKWWNGTGRELQDEYGSVDSLPIKTIQKLINVNMQDAFTDAIPSKFGSLLNDAKDKMNISVSDVDASYMGSNGVVYVTNKVFTPAEFASVAYPALAHQSLFDVIYWAIETPYDTKNQTNPKKQTILPYLLSMTTQYSLLLPTNNAMANYVDPTFYGRMATDEVTENPVIFEFYKDDTKGEFDKVHGRRYEGMADANGNLVNNGEYSEAPKMDNRNIIDLLMMDLLDQIVIVGDIEDGHEYYKTRGGSLIRVVRQGGKVAGIEGGWQMEHNHHMVPVTETYTKENGKAYQLDEMPPMGATKSLYMTMKEHDEYSGFLTLINNDYCNLFLSSIDGYLPANPYAQNLNMSLFDNYNYTVYVPTTSSIKALQNSGKLPQDNELEESALDSICTAEGWFIGATTETDSATIRTNVTECLKTILTNFAKYHVQDNSIAVGMAPEVVSEDVDQTSLNFYESMMRNPSTGRYYTLYVDYNNSSMSVRDVKGNTRNVNTTAGLYNNIVREYWFNVPTATVQGSQVQKWENATLFQTSDAVVHLIDEPLYYEDLGQWRDVVRDYLTTNK